MISNKKWKLIFNECGCVIADYGNEDNMIFVEHCIGGVMLDVENGTYKYEYNSKKEREAKNG